MTDQPYLPGMEPEPVPMQPPEKPVPEQKHSNGHTRRIVLKVEEERVIKYMTVREFRRIQENDVGCMISMVSKFLWNEKERRFYTPEEGLDLIDPLTFEELGNVFGELQGAVTDRAIPKASGTGSVPD